MWFVADRQSPSGLCIQHVRNGKYGPKPLPAESVLRKTKASSGQRPQDAFLLCFFLLEKSLCFICLDWTMDVIKVGPWIFLFRMG